MNNKEELIQVLKVCKWFLIVATICQIFLAVYLSYTNSDWMYMLILIAPFVQWFILHLPFIPKQYDSWSMIHRFPEGLILANYRIRQFVKTGEIK